MCYYNLVGHSSPFGVHIILNFFNLLSEYLLYRQSRPVFIDLQIALKLNRTKQKLPF